MNESQLDDLKTHQEELALKLLRHARLVAGKYGWRDDKTSLPAGKDPEDIVIMVVEDYLNDRRHFNPKYGVECQLKRAVQSELWALYQRIESHAVPLEADDEDQSPRGYETDTVAPDEAVIRSQDGDVLFEILRQHADVKGDYELELMVMAIEDGADDAPKMAAASGLSVARVYEVRKKLKKIWPDVRAQFHKGTEALQ